MIDLYTWTTPNGRKVSILLEELGVPYTVHAIDINQDEQFAPDFLKIAPTNRIPAIVDHETGIQMMESGAIMMYLADKYKKFQCDGDEDWRMVEWLMWQMGGLGPMLGQTHHFVKYNKGKSEYAEKRYSAEAQRLYGVFRIFFWRSSYNRYHIALFTARADGPSDSISRAGWSGRVLQPKHLSPENAGRRYNTL